MCVKLVRLKVLCAACVYACFLLPFSGQAAVLPPDPNNAALVYYQAFLICPEPPERPLAEPIEIKPPRMPAAKDLQPPEVPPITTECALQQVEIGGEPDELVRRYLWACRGAIILAQRAAQIPACDWGICYSEGSGPLHLSQAKLLAQVLCADAYVLAADGKIREAIERCMTASRIAEHTYDTDFHSYSAATVITRRVQECLTQILGSVSTDAETIVSLRSRLAPFLRLFRSPVRALMVSFESAIQMVRRDGKTLADVRRCLAEATPEISEQADHELTDEALLARLREPYMEFFESARRVIASQMPYNETRAEIQTLIVELERTVKSDPVANQVRLSRRRWERLMRWAERVSVVHNLQSLTTARLNALDAALAVYLIEAQAGQLPETFPDGLPGDPFSGEDFEYQVTDEGFSLRCRVSPPGRPISYFDFKIAEWAD